MSTTLELEQSKHGGRPIEYYHFYRATEDWYYTTSRRVKTLDGIPHLPLEINRGVIATGGADKPGALSIELPTSSAIGQAVKDGLLPTPLSLRITRQQAGASDDPRIIFNGEASTAGVTPALTTIQFLPLLARLSQMVPQGAFQKDQCTFATYDTLTCGLDRADFTFDGVVEAVDGLDVTITGLSDYRPVNADGDTEAFVPTMFALGILKKGEREVMIESQSGNTVRLVTSLDNLRVDDAVQVVVGDDRQAQTCLLKMKNIARNMSFSHMPTVNPYYGRGFLP